MNVMLEGVVGSTAYGLATEDSDVDVLGVYLEPIQNVLAMNWNSKKSSKVETDPDSTHHELSKFVSLCCKGNPTVNELLWLNDYSIMDDDGACLVAGRQKFLCTGHAKNAYLGYAFQQAERLVKRHATDKQGFASDLRKRTEKHARHCWRLLLQAETLLSTGQIIIDVSEHRQQIFDAGEAAAVDPEGFYEIVRGKISEVESLKSVLPDEPDYRFANQTIMDIRKIELT